MLRGGQEPQLGHAEGVWTFRERQGHTGVRMAAALSKAGWELHGSQDGRQRDELPRASRPPPQQDGPSCPTQSKQLIPFSVATTESR